MLSGCSMDLGPETLPSTTAPTETEETEPEVTETTLPPEATEPSSLAVVTDKVVEKNGLLSVNGTTLVNAEGETVVLKGISSYGIQDCGEFFTSEVVKTLAEDWGCDVLRIAVTGDSFNGGYMKEPDKYFDSVCKICDMCIEQGIYVIVDWNVNYMDEPDETKETAVDFFSRLSIIYPDSPNIIYEVANDPYLDTDLDEETDEWEDVIKPFASEVIDAVRTNNPNSIVIVGVPDRGADIEGASEAPLDYENVAYAYRFFSATTGDITREKVQHAIDNGICVFATEWGFGNTNGNSGISTGKSSEWIEFFKENQISWCNYAIGSNTADDSNALCMTSDRYTDEQKYNGHWPEGLLTDSGRFAREQFLAVDDATLEAENLEDETEQTEE